MPTLSVVIVTWNERDMIRGCLGALRPQLAPGDELIVADNGSTDGTPELVAELAPEARVVRLATNEGYMAACNAGAGVATGELLVMLNPDTLVADGFAEAIRRPWHDERRWAGWQALLTQDGGRNVNTSGGVVHFTGIAWAGHVGEPVEVVPPAPHEVPFLSSACLALPRATWERENGFPSEFFLYFDDVDLSLRLRLAGGRIGIEPAARVEHLYDFSRRQLKWRMLERNRWATVLRTYPPGLLLAVLPGLVLTELGLLAISARAGWADQKLGAMGDVVRALPRILRQRRRIQAGRAVSSAEFAAHLIPDLSSPFLGPAAKLPGLEAALRLYWRGVLALLQVASPRA